MPKMNKNKLHTNQKKPVTGIKVTNICVCRQTFQRKTEIWPWQGNRGSRIWTSLIEYKRNETNQGDMQMSGVTFVYFYACFPESISMKFVPHKIWNMSIPKLTNWSDWNVNGGPPTGMIFTISLTMLMMNVI